MLTFISDIEREELLKNQWLGISMDIEDISKKALTKFCQDIQKQARMEYGRNARKLYEDEFDIRKRIEMLEVAYRQVANKWRLFKL